MDSPRPIADYLRIHVPILVVYDADLRWATRVAVEAARSASEEKGGVGYLEWSSTRGWVGAQSLLQRLGLSQGVGGGKHAGPPMDALGDFAENLRDDVGSESSGPGGDATRNRFGGGIVVIHDLPSYLEDPVLIRAVADIYDPLSTVLASAVFPLPAPIPRGHPLESYVIQATPSSVPRERYGAMARSLVQRFRADLPGSSVEEVLSALQGLTISQAETICRLVAMDLLSAPEGSKTGTLQGRLRDERARLPEPRANPYG